MDEPETQMQAGVTTGASRHTAAKVDRPEGSAIPTVWSRYIESGPLHPLIYISDSHFAFLDGERVRVFKFGEPQS